MGPQPFVVTKSLTQSAIVAAGVDLTGLASGPVLIEDIVIQNGSTAATSATNTAVLEIVSNNTSGNASFVTDAEAKLAANVVLSGVNHTSNNKLVLESGKKLSVKATGEDFTSAGTIVFHIVCRPLQLSTKLPAA